MLGETDYYFLDGLEALASVAQGGLGAFEELDEASKEIHRGLAIRAIAQQCRDSGQISVVTGHLTFWIGGEAKPVFTQGDPETFTHILYLKNPRETIAEHRPRDERTHFAHGLK